MRKLTWCACALLALAISWGCDKRVTNNYTTNSTFAQTGSMYGRVISSDTSVTLVAYLDVAVDTITADKDGYYFFADLKPGVYRIEITSSSGGRRVLEGIAVVAGEAAYVGTSDLQDELVIIARDYPSGTTAVSALPRVALRLQYNQQLDSLSARASVSISPSANISVQVDYYSYLENSLVVVVNDTLIPNATYTVTIDSTLASLSGLRTGAIEQFSFTVDSIRVTHFGTLNSYYSGYYYDSLDPGVTPSIGLKFNVPIDVDSLNVATSFSPAMPGFWYFKQANYSDESHYEYFFTAPFTPIPEQVYTLTINGDTKIALGESLGSDETKRLGTRPVRITQMSPSQGAVIDSYSGAVWVKFNVSMDTLSTEAAFSCTAIDGTPVPGNLYWQFNLTMMSFQPLNEWQQGVAYKVRVDTTARSISGKNLKAAGNTFFRVGN